MPTDEALTIELFQDDPYLKSCDAVVVESDRGNRCFITDRTVFYPTGGGQPGDVGVAFHQDDAEFVVADTRRTESGHICHYVNLASEVPAVGDEIHLEIDWDRRYRHMRVHSCLHLLCAIIPGKVTGAQVGDGRGRVDFDVQNPREKHQVSNALNTLISQGAKRINITCTRQELKSNPTLMRNLSVKPSPDIDNIHLVHFENVDIQPCGGTHVANTAEIGEVRIDKIENKGRHNRRVTVSLADPEARWELGHL